MATFSAAVNFFFGGFFDVASAEVGSWAEEEGVVGVVEPEGRAELGLEEAEGARVSSMMVVGPCR